MIDKWSKLAETSKGECMLLLWIPVTVTVLLGGRLKNLSVKVSIYVSNMRNGHLCTSRTHLNFTIITVFLPTFDT